MREPNQIKKMIKQRTLKVGKKNRAQSPIKSIPNDETEKTLNSKNIK
jgi:hypothetical protein